MIALIAAVALSALSGARALDQRLAAAYSFNSSHPEIGEYDKLGSNGWTSYKQCDPAWANQQLGYCSLTICQAGCAMRSEIITLIQRR